MEAQSIGREYSGIGEELSLHLVSLRLSEHLLYAAGQKKKSVECDTTSISMLIARND
jgi:hypothetical protein